MSANLKSFETAAAQLRIASSALPAGDLPEPGQDLAHAEWTLNWITVAVSRPFFSLFLF
jgi:hypothetical protein